MVEKPSNLPPVGSDGQPKISQAPKPGAVNASGMPDPFPGMHMTSKQKKQFWNTMVNQMNHVIQQNTEKARKALKKLKESNEE